VVEGDLLSDRKDDSAVKLTKQSVRVFQVHFEHDRPFLIGPMTVDGITSLGT
jgi:hypothetical protein